MSVLVYTSYKHVKVLETHCNVIMVRCQRMVLMLVSAGAGVRLKKDETAKPHRAVIGQQFKGPRKRHVFEQPSQRLKLQLLPERINMGRQHVSSLALLLPVLASTANAASEPSRPRGVGPECMLYPLKLHQAY